MWRLVGTITNPTNSHTKAVSKNLIDLTQFGVSCSSEVPDVTDVLQSPTGAPEGSEQSEAEIDETTGSHQPACSGSPAQVTSV